MASSPLNHYFTATSGKLIKSISSDVIYITSTKTMQ